MPSSVTSTSSSSSNRITGMVSGMDTDTLVKQMMASDTAKIDKVKANKQVDTWKTEAYREVTSSLKTFYSTYFDTLSSTNLKSANSFASFSTSYGSTTSENYVTVKANADSQAGTYSITKLVAATVATITGRNVSKAIEGGTIDQASLGSNITSANNTLSITLNGATKEITFDTDGAITTVGGIRAALQVKINEAFGADKISVDLNSTSDGLIFSAKRDTDTFNINSEGTANSVLGLTDSNLSNKVDLTLSLSKLSKAIGVTFTENASDNDIVFTVNGESFTFNSSETSIQDIMDTVNSSTEANVTMKYNTKTNSFTISSNNTGVTEKLVIADTTGNFMGTIGINSTANGTDASVTLSDGTEIVRPTNSFTYDGLTYNIKKDFVSDTDSATSTPDPIEVTVGTDTTKTYDFIKGFVDKYNEIISKINEQLTEKKYNEYTPLTDAQKTDMTDDQITKWEEKAKSGLLKNDSILSGIVSKLRSTLYDTVEGAGISLSSIGISTTSDYSSRGKLSIDETKLKEALTTKSDQITKLFTGSSDKSYFEALDSSTIRSERYSESGIAQRFSDIIQDAIRTTTDSNGNKGSLLAKAGIVGDRSEYTNTLYKEMINFDKTIYEMNDRLSDRESAAYAKFTAMEMALNKLTSQQSYLSQMMGSSS
ncbi:MAG TPA: flagellar filament capping protein FliD [Ruminiclostridium sp.]